MSAVVLNSPASCRGTAAWIRMSAVVLNSPTSCRGTAGLMSAVVLISPASCRGTSRLDVSSGIEPTHYPVVFVQLRTRCCRLLSHLQCLMISHMDEYPCGTVSQTPEHILQHCLAYNTVWCQTWLQSKELRLKLWSCHQNLDIRLCLCEWASHLDSMTKEIWTQKKEVSNMQLQEHVRLITSKTFT